MIPNVLAPVEDPDFVNLPVIFRMISPLLLNVDLITDIDFRVAIGALAKRSPQETAYFLKQVMSRSTHDGLDVLTRKILGNFPIQYQEDMRLYLRQRREELREL